MHLGLVGDEVAVLISLKIQQRGEVAVIHGKPSRRRDRWFGVEGDTGPSPAEHGNIIRAVTDRHRLIQGQALDGAKFTQTFQFCFLAEDRLANFARHRPSRVSRTLPRWVAKPTLAATASVTKVKPPDTKAVKAPFAAMVRTRVSAPPVR